MTKADEPSRKATLQGLFALALWSSNLALSRALAETSGTLGGAALALLFGSVVSLALTTHGRVGLGAMLRFSPRYLFGCGALFVGYMGGLYGAVGLATDRSTVLLVGLLNYLWPALMVAFSVPLLGVRARGAPLAAGCLLALAGSAVAILGDAPARGLASDHAALLPLLLAAAAGVFWALYSNLARRWGPKEGDAVPLFLLCSAAAVGAVSLALPGEMRWTLRAALEVALLGAGPMALAYTFWERGVARGDHRLLGLSSYFLPVASLALAALALRVVPGPSLGLGCLLTVAGALLSRWALRERDGTRRTA